MKLLEKANNAAAIKQSIMDKDEGPYERIKNLANIAGNEDITAHSNIKKQRGRALSREYHYHTK